MAVLCAPWAPVGPRTSLDTNGVVLFVGALLSWLPVLANRRILRGISGGVVRFVVAGGPQKIAVYQLCFAFRWCIAFLAACASKSSDSRADWLWFSVLRGRRRGLVNRWILVVETVRHVGKICRRLCQGLGDRWGKRDFYS